MCQNSVKTLWHHTVTLNLYIFTDSQGKTNLQKTHSRKLCTPISPHRFPSKQDYFVYYYYVTMLGMPICAYLAVPISTKFINWFCLFWLYDGNKGGTW